jgi:zinc/manganese transport system ATP-binding protein
MLNAVNASVVPAIRLENITVSYDRKPALHHLTGVFEIGSLTAIAGPNGGGKSTLLKALAGIIRPDEGVISITSNKSSIAYLPQSSELKREMPLTVAELVASGLWNRSKAFGAIKRKDREVISEALAKVGLEGFEKRSLVSLSLGQLQRMLFARLIVQDAPLILLDEPFAAVDEVTIARLHDLILSWHHEGRTIICVLHNMEMIRRSFERCLLLARDCIAWGACSEVFSPENLLMAASFQGAWPGHVEPCLQ